MRARDGLVLAALLVSSVGCDQVSKQAAVRWLRGAPTSSYLWDTFRLGYSENRGAFLGLGSDWPESVRWVVFTVLSTLLVVGALVYAVRTFAQARKVAREGAAKGADGAARWRLWAAPAGPLLVVAGGLGNLIDRVLRDGTVVDFMNLGIGGLRTGIFNVADVYIMVGVALWALWPRTGSSATPSPSPVP